MSEITHDATTIWENCFGYDENGVPGNLSFNHYAFGCVADWIYRNVNGVCPKAPGYRDVLIQPRPDGRLTFAKRTFETANGTLSVSWEIADSHFILQVQIPCNTTAQIILPSGKNYTTGSGVYTYDEVFLQ